MIVPEPPSGLAVEAGVQLDLSDAAAEVDVDLVRRAAEYADAPDTPAPVPVSGGSGAVAPAKAVMNGTGSTVTATKADLADVALSENMGDAPVCSNCGHMTIRNGSCYVCLTCGDTTGCS